MGEEVTLDHSPVQKRGKGGKDGDINTKKGLIPLEIDASSE